MTCISPTLQAFKIIRLLKYYSITRSSEILLSRGHKLGGFLPYDCERVAPSGPMIGQTNFVLWPFLYCMLTRMEAVGKEKEILEIIHFKSVVSMPCVPQCVFIMCVHVSACTNVHQGVCMLMFQTISI